MAKILIVDDNEQNLYMLRVLLETNGHKVSLALQGKEALVAAAVEPPDLVISDILMPVMDGFSFCRQWKAHPLLGSKPFIFYTATYTEARDEEFARSLGADRFVLKPQDPDRLLQIVTEVLAAEPPVEGAPTGDSESEFLKNYNLALFRKLEKKVLALEEANAALRRDMVLRLELEKQLIHAQKMESLGLITGGIVHDFNNVLTVIGGIASLLAVTQTEQKLVKERAGKILDAVRMGGGLGRQLLAFARKQDLLLVRLDLGALLLESKPLLKAALPEGISFEIKVLGTIPMVRADLVQLQQVFLNLVSNARDAIKPPGQLNVDVVPLDLDGEFVQHRGEGQPGRYVRIRFQDTGCGMSAPTLDRIFEPFYTTKESGRGTGLGLSVVYGIVRQHRGFLQVTSTVGRGSCFEVYLPADAS